MSKMSQNVSKSVFLCLKMSQNVSKSVFLDKTVTTDLIVTWLETTKPVFDHPIIDKNMKNTENHGFSCFNPRKNQT